MIENLSSFLARIVRERLLQINTTYSLGLKGKCKLMVNNEKAVYEFQSIYYAFVKLEINKDNFCMELYKSENGEDWIEIDDDLEFGTVDLSNEGDRWEGYCLNGYPCGYGTIYDENNNLVYQGFMFDGKKICFGEEYDNGIIRYRGTYMNDNKHGYGYLYDKKGELIYEGDWALNENDGFNVNISNGCVDDDLIHNLVRELIIGNNCYNDLNELKLNDYSNLSVLSVGSESFNEIKLFELTNCEKLEEVTIGNESMKNTKSCKFLNLPQFATFKTGDWSFSEANELSLSGI